MNQVPSTALTPEQQRVLEADDRLVVVQAAPGSGKTRLFVEVLRRHLSGWSLRGNGVAALSFTNVAQQEVADRLGGPPAPPHFVGTLDSFFLRFVVRPFAHLLGASPRGVRLIPAPYDLEARAREVDVAGGGRPEDRASILALTLAGGSEDAPTFTYVDRYGLSQSVGTPQHARLLQEKRREWERTGRITHSDNHYLAAALLRHPVYGSDIARIVGQRFPVILVDELQDTGWFLGRALLTLLENPNVRGLLVGDPDQSIYEFRGASPALFNEALRLPGAKRYSLSRTHRCAERIASVVSALSVSGQTIEARSKGNGRALLLVHDHAQASEVSAELLLAQVRATAPAASSYALLGRATATVQQLNSSLLREGYRGHSRTARQLDLAARRLADGAPAHAARLSELVLTELLLNGGPQPSAAELQEAGISRRAWSLAIGQLVWASHRMERPGETWGDWKHRMREVLSAISLRLGTPLNKRSVGARFKQESLDIEPRPPPAGSKAELSPVTPMLTTSTVHQVKGAEFDCVTLFVPKPKKGGRGCPSTEWWSEWASAEERRIAYVAASRARNTFVLCVHRESYNALRERRPDFLSLFEVHGVESESAVIGRAPL
ncbi:UvrD-helicase domain-containing protein [Archangium violaceum]|uniref:UvrD-helicase domain-containing protein n=1 Tax=Archangium violaceum TaxID=83451 RepID=UPI0036DC420F